MKYLTSIIFLKKSTITTLPKKGHLTYLHKSYKHPLETITISATMHKFFIFVDGEKFIPSLTIEKHLTL